MEKKFKWIGFDADDTLWENEPYFREAERCFCELLKEYGSEEELVRSLLDTEIGNIEYYGYGIKGFILSLIETGLKVSDGELPQSVVNKLIDLGKELLCKPVVLLDGVEEVLISLVNAGYRLIVVTKGDLLDQQRKLQKSGLEKYFHHIEIVSEKNEDNYRKLLGHLDVDPKDFLMVGNSLKSDVMPVLGIGAYAVHVPFHTTWIHEHVDNVDQIHHYWEIEKIAEIHKILDV
ncbi:HAD family hydrolase [Plebeiibacterium marinum]|uniref:HAD family hydrolase n=1 Tax=Plebeiibacterium marinum TaxID=2992111 RepID=A0AAE3MH14_9BACT|nr:HAD family hydrolase [Plebeiobacterium marinum]MCW3806897.1 HAD family hydrolase [Plebeiobacterium marinum]